MTWQLLQKLVYNRMLYASEKIIVVRLVIETQYRFCTSYGDGLSCVWSKNTAWARYNGAFLIDFDQKAPTGSPPKLHQIKLIML